MYYCSNVWANTTNKNVRKLQAVQKFACRIVSGTKKYDHVTPLLKSLSWLPVKDQLYYRQAIMAFKCMTGEAPEYLASQFITRKQVSERTTRSSQKLNIRVKFNPGLSANGPLNSWAQGSMYVLSGRRPRASEGGRGACPHGNVLK